MALQLVENKPVVYLEEFPNEKTLAEVRPLLEAHHAEVSPEWLKDLQTLEPQFQLYLSACEKKNGVLFTMRTKRQAGYGEAQEKNLAFFPSAPGSLEGEVPDELVGYCFFWVYPALHFPGCLEANCDVIYVKPGYRGIRSFRFAEQIMAELKERGVKVVHAYCQVEHDLTRFWEGLGFKLTEHHFSMRLVP